MKTNVLIQASILVGGWMMLLPPQSLAATGESVSRDIVAPNAAQPTVVTITTADEARAKDIVSKMTLEEKLDYIGGVNGFSIRAIPRLNLPEIKMADGPQGIRNDTKSTMYPAGVLSASTWNRRLVQKLGEGLGQDARARGISFLLGPGVCIYRAPMCGRNFEYFGEDPYLASETAKQYVLGVQSQGVIATIKHFAANDQEWDRHNVSSDVDERTLQEIYFATFRKAVTEAGVGAVMNSYNLVNSVHATENRWMNIDVLRHQWGFKGVLMSDWVAVYSAVAAANGGLDLEMPSGAYMNKENLLPAIRTGLVEEKTIDLKVQHILQTLIAFGMLDRPQQDKSIPQDNPFGKETALALAREGIVLLKNEGNVLPLKGKTAVLGPNADYMPTGGGSGFVTPYSSVTTWQGLHALDKKNMTLISDAMWVTNLSGECYADASATTKGFKAEYFASRNPVGKPVVTRVDPAIDFDWKQGAPAEGLPADNFSARWTGVYKATKSGMLRLRITGDDGYVAFVNGKRVIDVWRNQAATTTDGIIDVEAGKTYDIRIEYFDNASDASMKMSMSLLDMDALKQAVAKEKNVVLCVGFDSSTESEGFDRTFSLPEWQNKLIAGIADVHKNVTVVVNAGGGIDFRPWIDKVQAVVMAWYPGQEGGQALAEILTGRLSPSGKLTMSMEKRPEDNPTYNSYYDPRNIPNRRVQYTEGVFLGYRGYDRSGVKPLFPFGFGLSYTTFAYSNLRVEKTSDKEVTVSFDVTNTGEMAASEVAQVYVHDVQCSVPRPYKELKGYDKVFLKRGETRRLSIRLQEDAFSFYDVDSHSFKFEPGEFQILVGPSSASLPLQADIRL